MIKAQSKLNETRLASRIGYQFKQPDLLKLALTHRSVSHKHNYERLEFLGDSLLGMIIANYLYTAYPQENEGRLTRMRATLVRQEALGKIANDLKLSQNLILSTGELKSGGHHRESILADAVEAIIGAIYIDCGDLNLLQTIVLKCTCLIWIILSQPISSKIRNHAYKSIYKHVKNLSQFTRL